MRIIAGSARGRRFDAPAGMDTRPTLDRVKEAMFGMVQFELLGADVLDLFSGSGNLGLEAASRGARSVVCNDRSRTCAEQIRKNAEALGFTGTVTVLNLDYVQCIERLETLGKRFRFIFLDAPYRDGTAARAAALSVERGLLAADGCIFLEHAYALPPEIDGRIATIMETRKYGACAFSIIKEAQAR